MWEVRIQGSKGFCKFYTRNYRWLPSPDDEGLENYFFYVTDVKGITGTTREVKNLKEEVEDHNWIADNECKAFRRRIGGKVFLFLRHYRKDIKVRKLNRLEKELAF